MSRDFRQPGRQRGAALMIMMLILVLGVTAVLVRELSSRSREAARAAETTAALAAAREALIAHAVAYDAQNPGRFGFLPCPDIDTAGGFAEGEAHATACRPRYRSVLGRFPWKTLGLAPARGSIGECLWYAVSGNWKAGGSTAPELLNPDSNGQFRVLGADATALGGTSPADRAVAVILAPGPVVGTQVRNALASGVDHCGGNYTAARYLERDTASGTDNSTVAAAADVIDDFISLALGRDDINDQIAWVTRADIEARLSRRADFGPTFESLTSAVAKCIADYGRRNAAGPGDRRLPWPAPVDLAQYRSDSQYDDTSAGDLSGRVANRVDDSNSRTGNALSAVLTNCSSASVPEWTPTMLTIWRNWKDHLFYAVAASFHPDAAPHSSCGTCLTVNGAGSWAAVVMFSGSRLDTLGQVRDEPPLDTDTRGVIGNYLEGRNSTNHPNSGGAADYESAAANPLFNDILYCIAPDLSVSSC